MGLEADPASFSIQNGIHYRLFPNPLDDYFFVQTESEGDYNVQVFDMLNRPLYKAVFTSVVEVETRKWQPGLYTVILTDTRTGQYVSQKIAIQRL